MTNYDGIILEDSILTGTRNKKISNVHIVNVFNFGGTRNTITSPIVVIKLLPDFRDENNEYGGIKQPNSFEGIFPFGDSQLPPRRTPLEISWTKARN